MPGRVLVRGHLMQAAAADETLSSFCRSGGGRLARNSISRPSCAKCGKSPRKLLKENVGLLEGGGSGLMIMRSGSGGRRVVRQRLDGDGDARQPLGAAVGGKRAVVDEIDGRERERERPPDETEELALAEAAGEKPLTQRRDLLGGARREGRGRPARPLRRAARCRAAPPARRCRDGSWRCGRCRRPGAAGVHPRQGVAVRVDEDAPRRRAGRTLPAVDALPAARGRGRNPKLRRDRGTAQPRRLAKPLGLRPDLGRMRDQRMGVLRRGPRGGRPQVQEMRARKNRPARRAGGWRWFGARAAGQRPGRSPRANYIPSRGASRCQSRRFTSPRRGERPTRDSRAGEGPGARTSRAPHPNPLPASGERGRASPVKRSEGPGAHFPRAPHPTLSPQPGRGSAPRPSRRSRPSCRQWFPYRMAGGVDDCSSAALSATSGASADASPRGPAARSVSLSIVGASTMRARRSAASAPARRAE